MYYFFEELFIIVYLIAFLIASVIFVFEAIAISGMAKRRGIENTWLAFIPVAQKFMLGKILDNINAYRHKKTFFSVVLAAINLVVIALSVGAYLSYRSQIPYIILSILQPISHVLNVVVLFLIYKDYSVKSWLVFGILSLFMNLDFIFLFCLRKVVPISMCFSKQDEWQFEMNENQLQLLWAGYHMQPYKTQTWAEFLMMNFVPVQQYNPNMQGTYNNPYAQQNMDGYNQYDNYQNPYGENQYNQNSPDLDNNHNNDDDFKQE